MSAVHETTGVTLTVSAEAEGLHGQADAGLLIRVMLDTPGNMKLSGVSVDLEPPPGTRVEALAAEAPGYTFRLLPAPGHDGATVFREAVLRPRLRWSAPAPGGEAVAEPLRLLGLWGEAGLRRTVLPTGLTVATRERPDTATVAVNIAVRAGARDEDDSTHGGSHWLEHAHFLGTSNRPSSIAIDNAIRAVGGQGNASTRSESTDYWYRVPADKFDVAVDVLADQMLNSTFLPESFERERHVVFEELKRRQDTPQVRAFDEFLRLVFQVSRLRRDAGGTIESVQAIPVETILAYRAVRYLTGNMTIAAVGNLRHDEAVSRIARTFAGLPHGTRIDRPYVAEPVQTEPRRLELGSGTRIADIRMGWPTPGDTADDAPPMYILEDILGTSGRRLTEEIRDRRALANQVSPDYLSFSDAGAMSIGASMQAERLDEVVEAILGQIRRLCDGDVTDAEVEASIRAIAGRRALSDESNLAQAQSQAIGDVSGTLESDREYQARIRRVTAADVQRVARAYLDPANYTIVIVRS